MSIPPYEMSPANGAMLDQVEAKLDEMVHPWIRTAREALQDGRSRHEILSYLTGRLVAVERISVDAVAPLAYLVLQVAEMEEAK